jgi:Raf kinase inhibitor-like YbhB/YbcL family protein
VKLESESFENGDRMPEEFAMGVPADEGHATFGENRNPHLKWSEAPAGTKSFALICHDPDVPSKPDDVNQEGRTVPADLPRVDFFHWVLVDIPAKQDEIAAGAHSAGVTPKGKSPGFTGEGTSGLNGYTDWFAGDPDMGGEWGGYDGPFPPWNDSIVHHYHFTVHALDTESLGLDEPFTGPQALEAMKGHVLDQASLVVTYSLNPDVA